MLLIIVTVVALISIGGFALGLAAGYWRGRQREQQLSLSDRSELDKLAVVGRAILGAQLRIDALCEIVYQQATRIVDTTNFQLGLIDRSDYEVKVWIRDGERRPVQTFVGAADAGLIGWVRQTAQGLRVGDYKREWETLPARPNYVADEPSPRSAVFTPLIAGGEVIGVLIVQSAQPDAFSEEAQRSLSVLASQAGGALHNAQLYARANERANQLRTINEVGRQITAVQALSGLLRQVVTIIQERFHYYAVSIFTVDPNTNEIRLRASNLEDSTLSSLVLKLGEGIVGTSAAEAKTISIPNVENDARYLHHPPPSNTKSEVCVPLLVDNRVLGLLDVQSDKVGAFTAEDVFVLEALAGQVAMAVQEAQAYENTRRQAERINAMADASRAVVSILDINDLLDEVVDLIADYFGYDRVHLFLRSGDQIIFRSGSGVHSAKWSLDRLTYHNDDNGFIPWVARTGQALITGNVEEDKRYVPGPGLADTRSEMTIPISMGQRILGVFDIQSPLPNAFDPEDAKLVQALSDTVAVGLRNAGLFATEQRRRGLAETMREVSTALTSSLDLESVLEGILVSLDRVVQYEAGLILLRRQDDGINVVSAVRGMRNEDDVLNEIVLIDDDGAPDMASVWSLVHHMEAPDAIADATKHDHLFATLQADGDEIGMLAVDRYGDDKFSPEEVEIVNTFANVAAVAISNAQLYTAQKEQAWVSTALLQVAEATSRSTSLDEVLSTVAQITPLLSGVEWCVVFLVEEDKFRVVELEGMPEAMREQFRGMAFHRDDWEPFKQLRDHGKPVILMPPIASPRGVELSLSQVAQAVMLPLIAKGELMGAMLIAQREGFEPLTDRKVELVSGIANQAALAIEGTQLWISQQEEAWVTTALLSVAESVNSTLDLEQTLITLTRLTPMLIGIAHCAILQWNPHQKEFSGGAVFGLDAEKERQFMAIALLPTHDDLAAELIATENPISAGRGQAHPLPLVIEAIFGSDPLWFLPLVAKGNMVGCMIVDHLVEGEQITQRRMNILTGIAHQSALALETARLQEESMERQRLERELEVAANIQHSFLPNQLPQLEGWGLAAYYRAARQVGGDFYDFIPIRGGKWGIVIADVADKGVPAALFMALSRTNIRAAAYSRTSPAETLARVNELLLADSRSDLFVTVWYGVWDPTTGEIAYACTGHNPPLLVRATGETLELSAKGIALNVIETIVLEEKTVTLQVGDVLIAYTDGLTDAMRNDQVEFGVSGLRQVAGTLRDRSATDIKTQIINAVDEFTEDLSPFDDLTLVVLKNENAVVAPAELLSAQTND